MKWVPPDRTRAGAALRGAFARIPEASRGPLAAGLVFVLVALTLHAVGISSRRYVREQQVLDVATPAEASQQLRRLGIHGRVMVVFTGHIPIVVGQYTYALLDSLRGRDATIPVSRQNFATGFVVLGFARQVFQVVPDRRWPTVSSVIATLDGVVPTHGGYDWRLGGAPVIITRASDVPPAPSEKYVVYVSDTAVADFGPEVIAAFTRPEIADIVIREASR